ncbi:MAG TPA: PPC domain-containing DNA-binding protein [Tissierellales bacterium]|nr:PPC domain-containing DNA-binding protein [Tissierellales bacterium]
MDYKKFGNKYILRLEQGEEVVTKLKEFCKEQNIKLGWIKGIGAVNKIKIGIFKVDEKVYYTKELRGDYEITSLLGNISTMDGEVYLHLHINLSDDEYKTYGGHLDSAIISATGELVIEAIDGIVDREFNQDIGISLFKFD